MLAERSMMSAMAGGPVSRTARAHCASMISTRPIAAHRSNVSSTRYARPALLDSRAYSSAVNRMAASSSSSVAQGGQLQAESSCHVAPSAAVPGGMPSQSASHWGMLPFIRPSAELPGQE